MPAMCLGEMLYHWQADTAQAFAFRGEKWLEGTGHRLLRHSDTAVFNAELDKSGMALNCGGGTYRDQTAIRHCIARVEHEIQDGILQAHMIAFRGRQAGFEADLQPDVRLACASNECRDFSQAGAHVGRPNFVTQFTNSADSLSDKHAGSLQGRPGAGDHGLDRRSPRNGRVPCDAVRRGRDLDEIARSWTMPAAGRSVGRP